MMKSVYRRLKTYLYSDNYRRYIDGYSIFNSNEVYLMRIEKDPFNIRHHYMSLEPYEIGFYEEIQMESITLKYLSSINQYMWEMVITSHITNRNKNIFADKFIVYQKNGSFFLYTGSDYHKINKDYFIFMNGQILQEMLDMQNEIGINYFLVGGSFDV